MPTWKQERPTWCPHTDCGFCMRVHDSLCGGHLPKPEPHDGDFNDHRLCLRFRDDGEVVDFQCNDTDLWHLTRVIEKVKSPPKSGEVAIEHDDKTTAEHVFESLEVPDITEPDAEEGEGGDVDVVCSKCGSNDICPSDIEGMFICRSCGADLYSSGVSTDDMLESIAAATAIYPRSELEFEVALTTALRKANNVSAANNALRIRVKDLEAELERVQCKCDDLLYVEASMFEVSQENAGLDSDLEDLEVETEHQCSSIDQLEHDLSKARAEADRLEGERYKWKRRWAAASRAKVRHRRTSMKLTATVARVKDELTAHAVLSAHPEGQANGYKMIIKNAVLALDSPVDLVRLTYQGYDGDLCRYDVEGQPECVWVHKIVSDSMDDPDTLLLVPLKEKHEQEERHGGDDSGSRTEGNDRGVGGDDTG